MKQFVIVKPGTLKPDTIKLIEKSGSIVIEHPEPSEVIIISAERSMNGSIVMKSAIEAIADNPETYGTVEKSFVKNLSRKIKELEIKSTTRTVSSPAESAPKPPTP